MNVFSEKYIRKTERGTIRWIMLLESLQFLTGNPEWWVTKPLLVVLTSLETSALVLDVAAKHCLPRTKSPGSNIEVLGTYACFATITTLLCRPQFLSMDRHHLLQPHWHCVTMTSLWSHTVSYTRGCRGLSPASPARVHHYLTPFPATLFCWLWLCQSHIAVSVLPGILVPFPAQKLLNFFNHKVCIARQSQQQSSDVR